jgi:formylglycine-generating enzyme required for sulfatase activity
VAYSEWLSAETGRVFRLPNEGEWEKACRGTDGRIYPWGDSLPNADMVNYDDNIGTTTPVGTYSPQSDSPYGLADMAGNVWEWTSSQYADYPFDSGDGREDMNVIRMRVMRGGAFYYGDDILVRCAARPQLFLGSQLFKDVDVGFRVITTRNSG